MQARERRVTAEAYFPIGAPPTARYTQGLITLTDPDMEQDND